MELNLFLTSKNYNEQLKVEIDYVDLSTVYINKKEISLDEIKNMLKKTKKNIILIK